MERNQNGYPIMQGRSTGNSRMNCPEQGTVRGIDDMPLGYAYVPIQKFRMLYSAECALKNGTLFEELHLPFGVY